MAYTLQAKYSTLRPTKGRKYDGYNWKNIEIPLNQLCNPWFKDPAIAMGNYVVGLANPFKNNLPLVPWL